MLATTVVLSGVAAAPGLAEPGDTDGSSQGSGDSGGTSGSDAGAGSQGSDAGSSGSDPGEPAQSADTGSGSEAPPAEAPPDEPAPEVVRPSDPEPAERGSGPVDTGGREEQVYVPPPAPKVEVFRNSITLPWLRLPAAGEIPPGTWPTASTFYTTVVIPVPTLGEFLQALRIVPAPAPVPGPAFRTQQEAPAVADAGTGTTTGGGGGGNGGAVSDPVVFRAPLVTVPRATTIAGKPTKLPPGTPASAPPGVTQPGSAGVPTPAIRGSLTPTPGVTAPAQTAPAGAQAPRASALPRGVTNPTLAEIAAVALPGVAGLIFLTFGGGMIGYRQANSVRYVRTAGAERFLP